MSADPCNDGLSVDGPATYQIRVKGRIKANWCDRLEGMAISSTSATQGPPVTTLFGALPDQAALAGVMNTLHNLRLPILSVECLADLAVGNVTDGVANDRGVGGLTVHSTEPAADNATATLTNEIGGGSAA